MVCALRQHLISDIRGIIMSHKIGTQKKKGEKYAKEKQRKERPEHGR